MILDFAFDSENAPRISWAVSSIRVLFRFRAVKVQFVLIQATPLAQFIRNLISHYYYE